MIDARFTSPHLLTPPHTATAVAQAQAHGQVQAQVHASHAGMAMPAKLSALLPSKASASHLTGWKARRGGYGGAVSLVRFMRAFRCLLGWPLR